MKKCAVILLFVANVMHGINVDSLLKVASAHKVDSAYVMLLAEIAGNYEDIGDYNKSIKYCLRAKKLADSLHYKYGLQTVLNNLGNSYMDIGDIKKSLECHLKVLKLREELGNKLGIAYSYLNLGNIYFRLGEDKVALQNYELAKKMLYSVGDTLRVATCLSSMGSVYSNSQKLKEAESYYLKALAIHKRYNNTDGVAESLSNLSVTLMDALNYKKALEYAFETITLYGESGSKMGKAISYSNIGDIYEHMGDLDNAIKYQNISLQLAKEMQSEYMLLTCYELLAVAYSKKKDYINAVYYLQKFSITRDSMMNSENSKVIAEMQAQFETEKKEKEIQLLQTDKSIRELQLSKQEASIYRQRIIIFTTIGGLLIVSFLILFVMRENNLKKKIQLGLEKKNLEITIQKNQIEEKGKLITDSIDYARSIQSAVLPPDDRVKSFFPNSFIIYEPKDIVSGDFYWLREIGGSILFATVDCKGEGVPGAFMSIIIYNVLESIALEKEIKDPALILKELNESMIVLNKKSSVKYSAELSIISFNFEEKKLQFAGTKMPLVLVRDSKPCKFNSEIGKSQSISVKKNDIIYMFTNEVFLNDGSIEALSSLSLDNLEDQKQIQLQKLRTQVQRDDYLVVGIKV